MAGWYEAGLRTFLNPGTLGVNSTDALDWVDDGINIQFVDAADYTVDLVNHDFFDDIPALSRVGASTATATKTVQGNGTVDAADTLVTAVTGDPFEAIVIYKQTTGADSTDRLILHIDGFGSVTPNGGDITVVWAGSPNFIARI